MSGDEVMVHPARLRDVLWCRLDEKLAVNVELLALGVKNVCGLLRDP